MICERPYIKSQNGVTRMDTLVDANARAAATPFGCGRCLPCRINKSREWYCRILIEQLTHGESVFVTLTYNDDKIDREWNLEPDEVSKYIKRIRRAIYPEKMRYFLVGEYGTLSERPHYHIVMFGMSIVDEKLIESKWEYGFVHVGELNEKSAQYITGYVIKDMRRPGDERLNDRTPEFARMSKGIGLEAIRQIAAHTLNTGYETPRIIREIQCGKKKLPLGRYLTEKLCDLMGISESRRKADVFVYQEGLFNKYMKGGSYYLNMVDDKKQERMNMMKKAEIFKKKGSI